MTAGDYLAGEGLAGEDGLLRLTSLTRIHRRALWFDPGTRSFRSNDDGQLLDIHEVDASVQLALHFQRGKIASSVGVGNDLKTIKFVQSRSTKRIATDMVRVALSPLTKRGDVKIDNVSVEFPNNSAVFVQVDYFNLRLDHKALRNERVRLA